MLRCSSEYGFRSTSARACLFDLCIFQVAVLQRNLSAVQDLWKDCTRYYSPSIITLRKFVKAFSTLGDLQSAYHILQLMVILAGEHTDHLRVSPKRRLRSTRLDIPVPALNEVEDLKLVSDYDLPSSCQGKMGTQENLVDAQPGAVPGGNSIIKI